MEGEEEEEEDDDDDEIRSLPCRDLTRGRRCAERGKRQISHDDVLEKRFSPTSDILEGLGRAELDHFFCLCRAFRLADGEDLGVLLLTGGVGRQANSRAVGMLGWRFQTEGETGVKHLVY